MRRNLKVNFSFLLFFQAIFRFQILVAVLLSFIGIPAFCKVSPLSFLKGHRQLVGVTVNTQESQSQPAVFPTGRYVTTTTLQPEKKSIF